MPRPRFPGSLPHVPTGVVAAPILGVVLRLVTSIRLVVRGWRVLLVVHFTVLVVGEDHRAELDPFDRNKTMEPYRTTCFCHHRRRVGEPGFDLGDPSPDCRFCGGTGILTSTDNRIGQWDAWMVTQGHLRFRREEARIPPAPGDWTDDGVRRQSQGPDGWDRGHWCDVDLEALDAGARANAIRDWDRLKDNPDTYYGATLTPRRPAAKEAVYTYTDEWRIKPGESRDEFLERRGIWYVSTLVIDGAWHTDHVFWASGELLDPPSWTARTVAHDRPDWQQDFRRLLDDIPPAAIVTRLDCHF